MESAHEDGYQVDDYDLRSIIIEVLQDGNPRGYITRRRAEQQRKAAARDREEKEDYYEGRYRMSPEDGQAYEETRTPNDLEKYGGVSEEEMAAQQAEAEEAAREQREADEAKTSAIIDEVLAKEEAELGAPLEVDYEMTPGGALKGYAELEPKTAPKKKAAPKKGRASLREGGGCSS